MVDVNLQINQDEQTKLTSKKELPNSSFLRKKLF